MGKYELKVDHIPLLLRTKLPQYDPLPREPNNNIDQTSMALSLVKNDDKVKRYQQAMDVAIRTDNTYQQAVRDDQHEIQLDRLEHHMQQTAERVWPKEKKPKQVDPRLEVLGEIKNKTWKG